MGSRLFNRHQYVVGGALSLAFVMGCGSKFSAADTSAGGASGGSSSAGDASATGGDSGTANAGSSAGGSASVGGAGGDVSVAGASAGSSSAGTGGKPASSCSCAAGNYCQDGTNKCRSCTDFSRLEFAAPQKVSTLPHPLRGDRFPRAASSGMDLLYRGATANAQRIWYAATPASVAGTPVSPAAKVDSGPLLAAGVLEQNFFFDRVVDSSTNQRRIMLANWVSGALTGEAAAPAPLNGTGTASDFSIAIAASAARAYWMSTRNGKSSAELLWAGMVGGAATTPAAVDLQVQAGTATCPWLGGDPKTGEDDATPWVNSTGTLLLFRSESVDNSCVSNDSNAFDLYAAPLSKDTGQPTAAGIPLAALNSIGGGSTETDPSLSTDSCSIYFASDSGTGLTSLYVAARN